jgi:LPS export ABC transporter protein LptC
MFKHKALPVFLGLYLASVLLLWGCAKPQVKLPPSGQTAGTASPAATNQEAVQFKSTHLASKEGGNKYWDLDASKIVYNESSGKADLYKVNCVFWDKIKQPSIKVSAPQGEADLEKQVLRFFNQVKAIANTGEILTGKEMWWNGLTKRLYGKGNIVITKGESILTADELELDPNNKEIQVKGNVKVLWKNGK